jgi:hypothetical protein
MHGAQQIELLEDHLQQNRVILQKKRRVIQMFTVDLTDGVAREATLRAAVLKELHDKYVAALGLENSLKNANETIDEHTQ